jgi:hypothetical protein
MEEELRVRWRGRELTVPASPSTTVAGLRDLLADATGVPAERQTLLPMPRRGRRAERPRDDQTLHDVFGDDDWPPSRPLNMLGTPVEEQLNGFSAAAEMTVTPMQDGQGEETTLVRDDVSVGSGLVVRDDLDELQGGGQLGSAPTTPPRAQPVPSHLRSRYRRDRSRAAHAPIPFPPALLDGITETVESDDDVGTGRSRFRGAEDNGDDEDISMYVANPEEEVEVPISHTNGATLRLEEMDDILASAVCGAAFIDKHVAPDSVAASSQGPLSAMHIIPQNRFMKAVVQAKTELKMLAVLILNFGNDDSTVDGSGSDDEHSGGLASGTVVRSRQLLYDTLRDGPVVDLLNENFVTFVADLGTIPDGGAALLHRLGLHSLPMFLLFSDVGTGVALVDMFAADYFGVGPAASDSIMARFLDILTTYESFYESARARRVASEARGDIISEQDAEFRKAQADDRARGEAEESARKDKEERERAEHQAKLDHEHSAQEEIAKAIAVLPAEPMSGGARIAVRLPDGRRVDRRFDGASNIGDVFTWCFSLGVRRGTFQLRLSFPSQTFTVDLHAETTLEAAGLVPTAALNVDIL